MNQPTHRQQINQWKWRIMQPEIPSKPKGISGAEVANAAELVNYQDGSVVSREIVKKPTGNVTIFAFEEGQGLSEHTAPFDALVYVLDGEAEINIAGKPHRLHGGEMILMPAQQPHALKALKRFKMILTMIRS
jgi:quercetin dioxygenase-like cupin family protein